LITVCATLLPDGPSPLTTEAQVGLQAKRCAGYLAELENVRYYLHDYWPIDYHISQPAQGLWLLKWWRVKLNAGRRRHR
jgi:hypothetical protein